MAKGIVTFQQLGRYGRLGNQMFQIASTIGIARRNGLDYAFPYWRNYDHLERFKTKDDIDIQKYFVNPLPIYNGPRIADNFVHWGYWPISIKNNGGFISICGHMQSEKYFEHCAEEIKYYFKMHDQMRQREDCAIHVRLGDYDGNYHPRMDIDYYAKAMKLFPFGTRFIVFSDDILAAQKMFEGFSNVTFSTYTYMNDFKFMRSCKDFIIANSTYSWWAAWLGEHPEKRVVAPSNWFGAIAKLDAKDIYCKNWIVI